MNNRISVIIPVYNVEKYLRKCLDSILNQTYRDLEIILVDDGSPDNCPSICDEYAKIDNRILVIHQKNAGLSAARNAGIALASGEYIGFIDSDDYVAPDFYEKMYNAIFTENADLVVCNFCYVDEEGSALKDLNVNAPVKNEILTGIQMQEKLVDGKIWYYTTAWNKLYKRSLFKEIRFPIGKFNEDVFVAHEIFSLCNKIVTLQTPLYYYVQRTESIMSTGASIKNLDEIEGFCKRVEFYQANNMKEYAYMTAQIMADKYICWKSLIGRKNHSDKDRIVEIDGMFMKAYFSFRENCTLKNYVKFTYSEGYIIYLKLKKMLRIHTRLRILKKMLCYALFVRRGSGTLIDTPTHGNLGDHAIVLAEQQFLKEIRPNYNYTELTAKDLNYHEKWYARLTPMNQDILVHGGGFMGALWPDEEYRFRRILQTFIKHRVIVFPQTITFDLETEKGKQFFEESKRIYSAHPNLTICVREEKSLTFMHTYMPKVDVVLVPDIVTLLKFPKEKNERRGILLCMRADTEKVLSEENYNNIVSELQQQYPEEIIEQTDTVVNYEIMPQNRLNEVQIKLHQFAGAKLIVTDRLHGMIFAVITNTPCIALGNCNGKVKGVYEWVKGNNYIRYLDDPTRFGIILKEMKLDVHYSYDMVGMKKEFAPMTRLFDTKR